MRCCTRPPLWFPRGTPPLATLAPTPDPDRFPPVGARIFRLLLCLRCCAWPPSLSPRGAPPLAALRPTPDPDRFPPVGLIAHALLYLATLLVLTWRPTPRSSSANTGFGQIPAGRSYCACAVVPGHTVVPTWPFAPCSSEL
jgi:hypothetical protein